MDQEGQLAEDQTWGGLVPRVVDAVADAVPAGAPVLVAADGFQPLLDHPGRRSGNFPQDSMGRPAHHRLPDDDRAVWHLEGLRDKGFGALVFPSTARWWLDSYDGLRTHLERRYVMVLDDDACRIYDIRSRRGGLQLDEIVMAFEASHGRAPSILDWDTGALLAGRLTDAPVITVGPVAHVDYIDRSIDLVVVGDAAPEHVVAEARRVAATAVLSLSGAADGARVRTLWRDGTEATISLAVVVDLVGAQDPAAHVRMVAEAVPPGLTAGITAVVDDPMDIPDLGDRVRVVSRSGPGLGGLLAAATDVQADAVVLVEAFAVPLAGSIAALMRTLVARPTVAAACGCVVDSLGFLLAAGGVLLSGGEVEGFGERGASPFLPLHSFVRPVAVCPPPVVALRADAVYPRLNLSSLGSPEGQYAALSLALRQRGGQLVYQPEARVLDQRPEPGLRPLPPADRAILRQRWPGLLDAAPQGRDGLTWYDLAAFARA